MSLTHLHLLLNHFPVIGALIGVALLALALIRKSSELSKVSLGLFAALGIVTLIVFFTGEPAEEGIEKLPGFSESITEKHEEFALLATIVLSAIGAMAGAVLALFKGKELPRRITLIALVLSIVGGGMMSYTAMLGGQVRHTEVRSGSVSPLTEPGD
jgi:uncharacterized membrane protein